MPRAAIATRHTGPKSKEEVDQKLTPTNTAPISFSSFVSILLLTTSAEWPICLRETQFRYPVGICLPQAGLWNKINERPRDSERISFADLCYHAYYNYTLPYLDMTTMN